MMNKRNNKKALLALFFSGLISCAFVVNADTELSAKQQVTIEFTQGELAQMLAPIALYPDTLLTHILIAATYPLEVVEADRFIKKYQGLTEQELQNKAEDKDWDPSVKALLAFPRILTNLSQDLNWMQKLGDAFLQDETKVLASIQTLRAQADQSGNLAQMDNVEIVREKQTIIIEPAQPEVVYVPYYDTRVVYGNWYWAHYPPVYWHRPVSFHYYHGPFYWHSGVHIAFDFFFSAFHWHNHHVVRHHHKKRYYHSNRRIATSHHAKRWHHNPKHRRGIAYRSDKVKHRYASHRPSKIHRSMERKRVVTATKVTHYPAHKAELVSNKHYRVKQKLNRAVKVSPSKGSRTKLSAKGNRDKPAHYISRDKRTSTKVMRNNSQVQSKWKNQPNVKPFVAKHKAPKHKVAEQSWSENKVKSYSRSDKRYSSKTYSKPSYSRAQGGHSSKSTVRVAKHSSNKAKSRPRHKNN